MVYVQATTLKDFVKNFDGSIEGNENGVFPYEYIKTDNYNYILDITEPFPPDAFNSTLNFMSIATYANAIKYALAFKDFDINANYPPAIIDNSYKFILYPSYLKYKVDGYRFQDLNKYRDPSNNVSPNDFEYFKQLFDSSFVLPMVSSR
ncbi:MAG: hypothetical protein EZS28_004729 [Streblomastix strix]|uniref:Uncharacterized protein n=1 Tax=Streblomastix strix TaxID=222440 RepID=A0A5J4WY51_9EUKA|nr:MAG: hypothetical protein EZS28_004729 [Streblomastix strix]